MKFEEWVSEWPLETGPSLFPSAPWSFHFAALGVSKQSNDFATSLPFPHKQEIVPFKKTMLRKRKRTTHVGRMGGVKEPDEQGGWN